MDTTTTTTRPAATVAGTDHIVASDALPGITRSDEILTVKKPSLFQRARDVLENNPVKTAIGASLTLGAAALGGMNYNRYGSPFGPSISNEDLRTVAAAGASLFASIR